MTEASGVDAATGAAAVAVFAWNKITRHRQQHFLAQGVVQAESTGAFVERARFSVGVGILACPVGKNKRPFNRRAHSFHATSALVHHHGLPRTSNDHGLLPDGRGGPLDGDRRGELDFGTGPERRIRRQRPVDRKGAFLPQTNQIDLDQGSASSASGKKNPISRRAFSSESEA